MLRRFVHPSWGGSAYWWVMLCVLLCTSDCSISPPIPVTLAWSELAYTVGKNKQRKQLLYRMYGYAKPRTLTALMGPSGAGKTTLLHVLAGRKNAGTITGRICMNGEPKKHGTFCRLSGYVEQHDALSPKLTVRELLEFSGNLRLPQSTTARDRSGLADRLVAMLQLSAVQHERLKDVSRGERKR